MRFAAELIGRVVFLRWNAAPGVGDMVAMLRAFGDARRVLGTPIVVIELIPPHVPPPSRESMADALRTIHKVAGFVDVHYVVIGGPALHRALIRSVITAMTFTLPDRPVYCRSEHEAVERACRRTSQDLAWTLEQARARGMIDDEHGAATV